MSIPALPVRRLCLALLLAAGLSLQAATVLLPPPSGGKAPDLHSLLMDYWYSLGTGMPPGELEQWLFLGDPGPGAQPPVPAPPRAPATRYRHLPPARQAAPAVPDAGAGPGSELDVLGALDDLLLQGR
jgi:hypothetical protein